MDPNLEGFLACFVAAIFFGSMFVPIRKYSCGDGFFVQWVMCSAIFLSGMIINALENFPTFHPLAMVGGVLWAIGLLHSFFIICFVFTRLTAPNLGMLLSIAVIDYLVHKLYADCSNATALPIISMIGMGTAMLIWGVTNCVVGWATSRFGLFGLKKEVPNNVVLNFIGLGCVVFGGFLFSCVKSEPRNVENNQNEEDVRHLVSVSEDYEQSNVDSSPGPQRETKMAVGVALSVCAGLLYGCTFVPVIYIQQHAEKFKDVSPHGTSYVFSMYSGAFATSTVLLLAYTIFKRNKPFVNPETILPAAAVGGLWSVAQISWFVANDTLSEAISFPIISMLPGVCGALWSVLYFHEIKSRKSLQILAIAILITLSGTLCVGLSKGS